MQFAQHADRPDRSTRTRASAATPTALARWRHAIVQGNDAFARGDDTSALAQYGVALRLAQRLFGHLDDADAGVAALVVAHHNLADTFARLQRSAAQCEQLCAAHDRLCVAMDDEALAPAWRFAALQHSRRTYTELTHYLQRHPDDARARAAADRGAAGPRSALQAQ